MDNWRPIPSCPGYEASEEGKIRSIPRYVNGPRGTPIRLKGKILSQHPAASGKYMQCTCGRGNVRYVHHLVLEAFVGQRPEGHEAAHDNGDKTDNCLENLAWKTKAENDADKLRHGTLLKGERCPWAKLSAEDVAKIRHLISTGLPDAKIAFLFQVSASAIYMIRKGHNWKNT